MRSTYPEEINTKASGTAIVRPSATGGLTRRALMIIASASAATLLRGRFALAEDPCDWVGKTIAEIEQQIENLDGWVANDGTAYISSLKGDLASMLEDLQKARTEGSQAGYGAFFDGLGAAVTTTMAIIGVGLLPLEVPLATTILIGLAVSSSLLVAKAVLAPGHVNAVETATLQVTGNVEMMLEAIGHSVSTIAARTAGLAANLISLVDAGWELFSAGESVQQWMEAEEKINTVESKARDLTAEIDNLAIPGNLRAMRQEQLEALKNTLNVLLGDGCTAQTQLP